MGKFLNFQLSTSSKQKLEKLSHETHPLGADYNFLIFSLCCFFGSKLRGETAHSTNKQSAQHETAWNEIIFLIALHKVFITSATTAQRRKFTFVYRSLSNLGMPQAPESAHIFQPIKQPPENCERCDEKAEKLKPETALNSHDNTRKSKSLSGNLSTLRAISSEFQTRQQRYL